MSDKITTRKPITEPEFARLRAVYQSRIDKCATLQRMWEVISDIESEIIAELRNRLDVINKENDHLQLANASLRRKLDDIANQYAVDCL